MLNFKYVARDTTTGEKIHSEVRADNEQTAAALIRKEGLVPINIVALDDNVHGIGRLVGRIKTRDKTLFSRQLSTLLSAGLPLMQSLRRVAGQTHNKAFRQVINQIISDVEAGQAFSAALSRHPAIFGRIYTSMVASGETSGTLDRSLERLANQQEKDAEIISKVRGAMIYPIIVLTVMGFVVTFMVVKVLPQVEELYKGIPGATLPLVTRLLLGLSHIITKYWWLVLLFLALTVMLGSRWVRTFGGRRIVDRIKMRAWPIGSLFMKMYMARFARTAHTLVASGVPLIQVLDITASSINNAYIEDSIKAATEKVKGGKALSEALDNDPYFLELVPDMLKIGEQSGAMEAMLEKTADYYEKEVDAQIKAISTIVEPVLMVILGIFALIIVAAILLPIYGLAGKTIIR